MVGIDHVCHIVARNDVAHELVHQFCDLGEQISGGAPTVTMLQVALDNAGIKPEIASLADFGLIPADQTNN